MARKNKVRPDLREALLDLKHWDRLSAHVCEQLAQDVADCLPSAFRFTSLHTYEMGTAQRYVASFSWQVEPTLAFHRFSLIPGGTVTLGFDRARPFEVKKETVIDWQQYCVQCQVDMARLDKALVAREPYVAQYEAFFDYLAQILHPMRVVTLQPLLVEVTAQPITEIKGGRRQAQVTAFLEQEGFRLLTADEWEYVCAAGSRALFAEQFLDEKDDLGGFEGSEDDGFYEWADDQKVKEMATVWENLRNGFGLSIGTDRVRWEYCADPTMMKGGDGGKIIGYDLGFPALACAYFDPLSEREINTGVSRPYFRRAYDLAHLF